MAIKKEIAAWLLNLNKEQLDYALLKLEQAPMYVAEIEQAKAYYTDDDDNWTCPYCEKNLRRHA